MRLEFVLSMPPSINRTYGINRTASQPFFKRKVVTDWEEGAGWEVKQQFNRQITNKKRFPLQGNIKIDIAWFYMKNRDWDASIKVLCDLFEKQGIYENDMQIIEAHVEKIFDPGDPRVEVEINEVN